MAIQVGWNFNEPFTKQFKEPILCASWRAVKFTKENNNLIPDRRGVYIISVCSEVPGKAEPFSIFETPAYIGHSKDLRQRFNDHARSNHPEALWRRLFEFRRNTRFWFAEFPKYSTNQLKIIEQSLLDIYGSPLNKMNSVKIGKTMSATAIMKGEI